MANRLVVMIMGQNCERFISMCLESVKDADAIVYCDGGSDDNSTGIFLDFVDLRNPKNNLIQNEYNQEDKNMNGKQRNFYLKYLKENYLNDWCLCLDADEVLEDFGIEKLKQTILPIEKDMILSPRIHHFVGDLGYEDYTKDVHYVPNRLFRITESLEYPETEHPVLRVKEGAVFGGYTTLDIHIWHLRECLGIFETQIKFESNLKKSSMHTEPQLRQWQRDMLLGNYPKKKVHYDSIPTPIKNYFKI